MEILSEQEMEKEFKPYDLGFHGTGVELFKIMIVNWLFTIITLGIYYPWAKARRLKYIFASTSLDNERFSFHGLGKEMFIGLLKIFAIYAVVVAIFGLCVSSESPFIMFLGILVLYLTLFAIVPLAIHGAFRYRMSRTSLRGIRFGYRGDRKELFVSMLKWILLTLITLGIYAAWMEIKTRNYTLSKVRYGEVEAEYNATGGDYFILNLKGAVLSAITLGIYSFWWYKELFEFYVDNLSFHKEDDKIILKSTATAGGIFKLLVGNLLLIVFTLGIGAAWAEVRVMNFIVSNITAEGDIDLSKVTQTEDDFTDATGEGATDFFDIDLF